MVESASEPNDRCADRDNEGQNLCPLRDCRCIDDRLTHPGFRRHSAQQVKPEQYRTGNDNDPSHGVVPPAKLNRGDNYSLVPSSPTMRLLTLRWASLIAAPLDKIILAM